MQLPALHRVHRSVLFLASSVVHLLKSTNLLQDPKHDSNESARIRVVSDLYEPQTYPRNNMSVHQQRTHRTRAPPYRHPKNANRISHGTNKFNFRFILAVFYFSRCECFPRLAFYLGNFPILKVYYTHLESPHVPWVASIFQAILITLEKELQEESAIRRREILELRIEIDFNAAVRK